MPLGKEAQREIEITGREFIGPILRERLDSVLKGGSGR
jgi:hypothetical protein